MHTPLRSILALTLLAATGLAQAEDWQLAKQEDGIQVYTRAVAGAKYKAYRGVVQIKADPAGYVRVTSLKGQWRVVPKNGGSEVTYEAQSEPGGSVPSWLANSFVVDAPLNTLKGLRQAAQR